MAHLSNCQICSTSVLNDDLCLDCKDEIARIAISHNWFDALYVKKKVKAKRLAKMQAELEAEWKRMSQRCPLCGKL